MNTFIVFHITISIATFFGGFIIARQLRSLESVPVISTMFVQRKLLLSIVMGIFMSGLFTIISSATTKFLLWQPASFFAMFILTTGSCYFGITLGWGNSLSGSENIFPVNQAQINALPDNIVIDNTFNSVKITINTQKRWGWFAMALFQLALIGLCALPFLGLIVISVLQNYLPESMNILIWVAVGGLVLYLIYTKFQEALEYIFDKEIIEIDNLSVKIEKYGSGFKSRKEYSADNIKKITTIFSFVGTNVAIKRSPFVNSNMPAFIMWHNRGLKRYHTFGRAIDLVDAQRIC